MKKLAILFALVISASAFAQEKPKEVKEETEIKTVKIKEGNDTKEHKLKVVTRETANVELDARDRKKVNQDRVEAPKKVEKKVFVDNDDDNSYDLLSKETYYIIGDEKYRFTPNNNGFDIAFNRDAEKFVKVGKVWATSNDGYYLLNGQLHNGIGYFDKDGNFTIEYYNKETDKIEVKTYMRK